MVTDYIKSLSVVGPLLATTLAVTYDVGFFFGSDIGFFTFFSLTEHLVFALQAAPFALLAAGGLIGWLFGSWLGYQQALEAVATIVQSDTDAREKFLEKAQKAHHDYLKSRPYTAAGLLIASVSSLIVHNYTVALGTLFGVLAIYFFPDAEQLRTKPSARTIGLSAVALSALLIAFTFGYERARALVTSTVATETIYIDDKAVPARLIRSGDKGVLFYAVDTKKIRFVRWEAITQVESL